MNYFNHLIKLAFAICLFLACHQLCAQTIITSTWVSGDSVVGMAPVYGTKGVGDTANNPGKRSLYVNWVDSKGNFWIFGGSMDSLNQTYRNDIWMFNQANKEWTWIAGSDSVNIVGKYGTKGIGDSGNCPGARCALVSWKDDSDNFYLFGGYFKSNKFNDLWKFSTSTKQWTWVSGQKTFNSSSVYGTKGIGSLSNEPSARTGSVTFNDKNGNLWLFGGNENSGDNYNDLWRYGLSDNKWTWVSGSNSANVTGKYGKKGISSINNYPGARFGSVGMCDDSNNMYIWGGNGYAAANQIGQLNDFWKFNPSNLSWIWISGDTIINTNGVYGKKGIGSKSNKPGNRVRPSAWVDKDMNFWIFGGKEVTQFSTQVPMNDLWKYEHSNGFWVWMGGSNFGFQKGRYGVLAIGDTSNFPGARHELSTPSGNCDYFWIYGGFGYAKKGAGTMSDLWKLDICQNPSLKNKATPSSQCNGANVAFEVIGTGSITSYAWEEYNGSTWSKLGSDSNKLLIASVTYSQSGYKYRCIASGPCGIDTSNYFNLNVDSFYISSHPAALNVCENGKASFSVAGNSYVISYQWEEYNGSNWSKVGSNSNTYTIISSQVSQSGYQYRCWVKGSCDSNVSNAATLVVDSASVINTQPQPKTVCDSSTVSYTVSAKGAGLSYQWQENNGSGWNNVGTNSNSYSGTAYLSQTGYIYRCQVMSNVCNTIMSDSVVLSVNANATIDSQPVVQTTCSGDNVSFRVIAKGLGLTYAWEEYNGTTWNAVGTNSDSLKLNAVAATMSGNVYRCKVSSTCGNRTSSMATLYVKNSTTITQEPTNQIVSIGGSVSFSVSCIGANLQYQWEKFDGTSWTNVGTNSNTYTIPVVSLQKNGHLFRCNISGDCGAKQSQAATLSVNNPNGIAQLQLCDETMLSAFPNPFDQSINIICDSKTSEKLIIQLFDICGRAVWQQTVAAQQGGNEFAISTQHISSGIYLLRVGEKTVRLIKE